MAPPKSYMIPLQFPSGLYDYAKPPGPFAQWTSAPLYSYEEFARSNPRKGKYADVLTQHGKEGFVFPEKAPRVGSFPLYPLKSAKRAIQVVTLPSFDHKPEQREMVVRAVVSAHPSLKSEAERLLTRASDRMARSKRPCDPVPCEPVPCEPVKRAKKSSAPEGSLDARIETWKAAMLPRTKKYLSEGTKEMRGWGKYNGAMYMSDGHIAIPGYIGPTDEEYFNKTFRTYVRNVPVDQVFPDRSSLEEIYVTHVPTKEEAKTPGEDDYHLIRTTRAHAVNPKLMGIVANAVGPNLSIFQGPDPLSPIVVRGDKGEALIMPMRLTKSARKNRSDRKGRARRNGAPEYYDVPQNAGPFWPGAYPYGAFGRPAAYGPTAREAAEARAKPNPRGAGKDYSDVLRKHGRAGFGIPEKAPHAGSFPLYPIKRARYAIAIVAAPAYDGHPEERERILRAAVKAHPELMSEAKNVLARVGKRMHKAGAKIHRLAPPKAPRAEGLRAAANPKKKKGLK